MELSQVIIQLMKEKGISYQTLENRTGISRSLLQRKISRNASNLKIIEIEKIAAIFNKTPQNLLGWEEVEEPVHELKKEIESLSTEEVEKIKEYIKFIISLRK